MYGVLSIFMYGVYALISDTINISRDTGVDKAIADIGAGNLTFFFSIYYHILNCIVY